MSDEQPKEGGTKWELEQAEQQIADAGAPEIALGLIRYTQAIRNLIVNELAPDYIASLERVIDRKDAFYTTELREMLRAEFVLQDQRYIQRSRELQEDVIRRMNAQWKEVDAHQQATRAAWEETARGLKKLEDGQTTIRGEVATLRDAHEELNQRHERQIAQISDRLDRKRTRLNDQDAEIALLKAQIETLNDLIARILDYFARAASRWPELRDVVNGDGAA